MDPHTVRNNLDWYKQLFENDDSDGTILDGSTWCFSSPWVSHLLEECFNEVRVVIIVRDPAKRAYSAYLHMYKKTPCGDERSFEDVLSNVEDRLDSASLPRAEDEALHEAMSSGRIRDSYRDQNYHRRRYGAPFDTRIHDMLWDFKYFQGSLYSKNLLRFEKEIDNLKTILFEDLVRHPKRIMRETLEFANLPANEAVLELPHTNKTSVPRSFLARKVMEARKRVGVLSKAAAFLKSIGMQKIGRDFQRRFLFRSKEKMTEDHYERTRDILESEYSFWRERRPQTKEHWGYAD